MWFNIILTDIFAATDINSYIILEISIPISLKGPWDKFKQSICKIVVKYYGIRWFIFSQVAEEFFGMFFRKYRFVVCDFI